MKSTKSKSTHSKTQKKVTPGRGSTKSSGGKAHRASGAANESSSSRRMDESDRRSEFSGDRNQQENSRLEDAQAGLYQQDSDSGEMKSRLSDGDGYQNQSSQIMSERLPRRGRSPDSRSNSQ